MGTVDPLPSLCELPPDPGPCEAAIPAYSFNARAGLCVPFVYGGCAGNANRFTSLAECQKACNAGADSCELASDCVIMETACCGNCGQADESSFVSVNHAFVMRYSSTRNCNHTCGACPEIDELETNAQYFTAACTDSRCRIADVRGTDLTACTRDDDCRLRDGAACCEGCDGGGLVALNVNIDWRARLCNAESGCLGCVPIIPDEYSARCVNSRCTVTRVP